MTAAGGAFSLPGLRFLNALRTAEPYGPGSLPIVDAFAGDEASVSGRLWSVFSVEMFPGAEFESPPPLPPIPGGLVGVDDNHLRDEDDDTNDAGYLRRATKRQGRTTTDDSNLR